MFNDMAYIILRFISLDSKRFKLFEKRFFLDFFRETFRRFRTRHSQSHSAFSNIVNRVIVDVVCMMHACIFH